MTLRTTLWTLAVLLGATAVVFLVFQRQLAGSWLAFGVHPDVLDALDRGIEDQKRLAELDPDHRTDYHRRFETLATLHNRLRILDQSRAGLMSRYGVVVLGLFGVIVAIAGTVSVTRQRRDETRLERLRTALAALSAGRTDLDLGERPRDTIGRIAAMVEETSRVMARDRQRLEQLKSLSAWQEAARRHAHEMRTPLTAARLELERLRELGPVEGSAMTEAATRAVNRAAANVARELDRLAEFSRGIADFAKLPRPRPERQDLREVVRTLVEGFAEAWPGVELCVAPASEPLWVEADRDLLIQVGVNLIDNAVQAGASKIRFETARTRTGGVWVEVGDDGPGVPEALRERLFEPYVTSKRTGEGMGLGLAISKKILLDHGGDLELVSSSEAGARFRLTLPPAGAEDAGEARDRRANGEGTP